VLKRIMGLKGVKNLRLHNFAIGPADGEIYLVTPVKSSGHKGRAFAFVSREPQEGPLEGWGSHFAGFENQKLPQRSLDSFCAEHGLAGVGFLRCDIEGAEILLLDGGVETIERDRPVVMMEVHPLFLEERFGRSAEEVRDWFASRNYRIFYLKDGALTETDHFLDELWRDYFCVPAERSAQYGL
jgi:FkbM family methyltransferase